MWKPIQVLRDGEARCCTLSTALFKDIGLSKPVPPFDDGHECRHASQQARIQVHLDGDGGKAIPFCLVESEKVFAVMTGREFCWTEKVRLPGLAPLIGPPKTAGNQNVLPHQGPLINTLIEEKERDRKMEEAEMLRWRRESDVISKQERTELSATAKRDAALKKK